MTVENKAEKNDPTLELAELAGEMKMMRRMLGQATTSETKMERAMRLLNEIPDSAKVPVGSKYYTMVADRVAVARKVFGTNLKFDTTILESEPNKVSVRCVLSIREDASSPWHQMASGHAEEYRDDGFINKKSAVENCETSSKGRALAAFGLAGSEFASADEVVYSQFVKESAGDSFKVKDHRGQIVYTMPHGHKDEEKRLVAVRFAKTLGGELNIAPESAKKTIWKHNEDEVLRALQVADETTTNALNKIKDHFEQGGKNATKS